MHHTFWHAFRFLPPEGEIRDTHSSGDQAKVSAGAPVQEVS